MSEKNDQAPQKRMSEMYDEERDKVDEAIQALGSHGVMPSNIQKILNIQPQINESPFTFKNGFERRDDKRMMMHAPFLFSKSPV